MTKKKFVVFENYQGMGELEIVKGPEIREAESASDIAEEVLEKKNDYDKETYRLSGMTFGEEDTLTLDKCEVVKVDSGIILRLPEDEVNDIYILEIKE